MKKFALAVAAVMITAAAFIFGGQPAAAAPAADPVAKAATGASVQNVQYHNRWRSHHRWGSRDYHNRWRSHHRWGSRRY